MGNTEIRSDYLQQVVDGGMEMVRRELTVGTWGNISIRDTETGLIYIKPSGMPYESITPDDVVVMNSDKEIVWGKRKPSIEYGMHISIMNARPDVNVVIHTHPIYSSVFAVTLQEIPGISEDFVQIVGDKVICSEYALPGTPELAANVAKAIGERNAVLIPNHGTVCVGADVAGALKYVMLLKISTDIYSGKIRGYASCNF